MRGISSVSNNIMNLFNNNSHIISTKQNLSLAEHPTLHSLTSLFKNRATADGGATGNYLALHHISYLRDARKSSPSEQIRVSVADGAIIISSHHGFLDIPGVGPMIGHIFPHQTGTTLYQGSSAP